MLQIDARWQPRTEAARNNNPIASLRKGRLMAPGDSRSTGPGGSAQPALPRGQPPHNEERERDTRRQDGPGATLPAHQLILELVICEPEPLSGLVGPATAADRIAFHGWIDLMSAIHALCANRPAPPPSS